MSKLISVSLLLSIVLAMFIYMVLIAFWPQAHLGYGLPSLEKQDHVVSIGLIYLYVVIIDLFVIFSGYIVVGTKVVTRRHKDEKEALNNFPLTSIKMSPSLTTWVRQNLQDVMAEYDSMGLRDAVRISDLWDNFEQNLLDADDLPLLNQVCMAPIVGDRYRNPAWFVPTWYNEYRAILFKLHAPRLTYLAPYIKQCCDALVPASENSYMNRYISYLKTPDKAYTIWVAFDDNSPILIIRNKRKKVVAYLNMVHSYNSLHPELLRPHLDYIRLLVNVGALRCVESMS